MEMEECLRSPQTDIILNTNKVPTLSELYWSINHSLIWMNPSVTFSHTWRPPFWSHPVKCKKSNVIEPIRALYFAYPVSCTWMKYPEHSGLDGVDPHILLPPPLGDGEPWMLMSVVGVALDHDGRPGSGFWEDSEGVLVSVRIARALTAFCALSPIGDRVQDVVEDFQ